MLRSTIIQQLLTVKPQNCMKMQNRKVVFDPENMSPWKKLAKDIKNGTSLLRSYRKHWYCGGYRALCVAINLLAKGKIIAIPTDTIYGLAGLAQCDKSIERLYEIKKRDCNKPLAICLSCVNEIQDYAEVDDLPKNLLDELLPGPRTVILKRKPSLNPNLNPNNDDVGIRVPHSTFIRCAIKALGEPLALTSANESTKPSTLFAHEFEELWPQLNGIFYPRGSVRENRLRRKGSTIIDLTIKGQYKIVRAGWAVRSTDVILSKYGLKNVKKSKDVTVESKNEQCFEGENITPDGANEYVQDEVIC